MRQQRCRASFALEHRCKREISFSFQLICFLKVGFLIKVIKHRQHKCVLDDQHPQPKFGVQAIGIEAWSDE
jgi:hypothetical protein